VKGRIGGRRNGALVSLDQGKASSYALMGLEDRGVNFMEPGTEVYEGMVVGEHNRENDLTVNVTKEKNQTNVRSSNKDQTVTMKRPRTLTLE
ncbi:translational GTPase TypA, partial [Staphylococcus warneri]